MAENDFKISRVNGTIIIEKDGQGLAISQSVDEDIWFTTSIMNEIDDGNAIDGVPHYQPDTFEGIPDDVTVHLPESIPDDARSGVEDGLRAHGIPSGATFTYYSLR